jgi:hypothetical protein
MSEKRRIYHVVGGDEGVVDGDKLDIVALQRNPGHQPADPAEPCTTNAKLIQNSHSPLKLTR